MTREPILFVADTPVPVVNILFNGEPYETADDMTVASLLSELELSAGPVAVEVNLEVVPRHLHEEFVLKEGDRMEVVTLVGGG